LEAILGPAHRADLTADLILMRAVDRYAAGRIALEDLYRCRVLAYYLVFAPGGEEWLRWGIAASLHPGQLPDSTDDLDLADLPDPLPTGPPWLRHTQRPDCGDLADSGDPTTSGE